MMFDIKNYFLNNSWQNIFFKWSTCFFVGTLPLLLKINTIGLWLFILSTIFIFKEHNGLENLKRNKKLLIPLLLVFLMFLIGFFLSKDILRVQKDVGRVVPLFLIPLAVFSHRKKDYNLKHIYLALGIGLFVGMVICWCNIFTSILSRENYFKQATYFFNWIYTDWNLVKPLDGHPSYFAVLIVFFISALLFDKRFAKMRSNRIVLFLVLFPYFLF